MNATQQLHDLGQSLWLDNIGRRLLVAFYEHRVFEQGTIRKALQVPHE